MARPTKFNQERAAAIVTDLRNGCTRRAAAEANGVTYETFFAWLARYQGFLGQVTEAEAEAERTMTAVIVKAAQQGDTKSALEWLRRRKREDWGDNAQVEHSGQIGVSVDLSGLTDDELRRIAQGG